MCHPSAPAPASAPQPPCSPPAPPPPPPPRSPSMPFCLHTITDGAITRMLPLGFHPDICFRERGRGLRDRRCYVPLTHVRRRDTLPRTTLLTTTDTAPHHHHHHHHTPPRPTYIDRLITSRSVTLLVHSCNGWTTDYCYRLETSRSRFLPVSPYSDAELQPCTDSISSARTAVVFYVPARTHTCQNSSPCHTPNIRDSPFIHTYRTELDLGSAVVS